MLWYPSRAWLLQSHHPDNIASMDSWLPTLATIHLTRCKLPMGHVFRRHNWALQRQDPSHRISMHVDGACAASCVIKPRCYLQKQKISNLYLPAPHDLSMSALTENPMGGPWPITSLIHVNAFIQLWQRALLWLSIGGNAINALMR